MSSKMILGIESSCDDTGIAIVRGDGQILGHKVVGQTSIHQEWGGVVPKLAEEAHQQVIDQVVIDVMLQAKIQYDDLDAVAVTVGPGLALCLGVGIRKALEVANQCGQVAWLPIHHMEAHALVVRQQTKVQFPYLCLLVSGGHNLLLVVNGVGDYVQLGTTVDDAMGEAFDKVGRLLGLDLYPSGGAALENFAIAGDSRRFNFTIPMKMKQNCDFSYAGLKTAVRREIDHLVAGDFSQQTLRVRKNIAASFQRVAVEHLADRLNRALQWVSESHPNVQSLVVSGGVAANKLVRTVIDDIATQGNLNLVCPPPSLCTDNGVMVAWAGLERMKLGMTEQVPLWSGSIDDFWYDLKPRWPLTNKKHPRCEQKESVRSQKRKRVHTSLTEMTQQYLQIQEQQMMV